MAALFRQKGEPQAGTLVLTECPDSVALKIRDYPSVCSLRWEPMPMRGCKSRIAGVPSPARSTSTTPVIAVGLEGYHCTLEQVRGVEACNL